MPQSWTAFFHVCNCFELLFARRKTCLWTCD